MIREPGSGIGLAIATCFAAEGASIVAGDVNSTRLEAAVAGIREHGGTVVSAAGDMGWRSFSHRTKSRLINGSVVTADAGWSAV